MTHLKLQKLQKSDITQQHIDIPMHWYIRQEVQFELLVWIELLVWHISALGCQCAGG